jgi:phosphoenolpyruvate carboxykinase (ATP)
MKYLEFNTPATKQAMELASDFRLKNQGLTDLDRVFWNLPDEALYEEIIFRNEGKLSKQGPIVVNTGRHTARAAADKFVVQEQSTKDNIWWGVYNRPFSSEKFNQINGQSTGISARVKNYLCRIVMPVLIRNTECQ